MLSRVPVRARLAAGFAVGMALVLILAGGFIYVEVEDSLDDSLKESLSARVADAKRFVAEPGFRQVTSEDDEQESDDAFTQVLGSDGSVIFSTLPSRRPVLDSEQLEEAARNRLKLARERVGGIDDPVRILAEPMTESGSGGVVVAGASTEEMDETLADLRRTFLIGGPVALILASLIGYLLGSRALAPVESMRQRARQITLDRPEERLPVPVANDELRRLAITLNEMLARIATVLQRERVFVSDASHELRTPLAMLKAEIELVRRPGTSHDDLIQAVDSAAEEVDHLILLSESLLALARADSEYLSREEEVDPAALLERVRTRFAEAFGRAGRSIGIERRVSGRYPLDRLRLERALSNLVDNALKHGGGEVSLGAGERDGQLVIYVRDEGPGFAPDFREQAFERFTRADSGRTGGGAGLGLAIVRAITEAHGGRVEIPVREGGTEVQMVFPLTSPGSGEPL